MIIKKGKNNISPMIANKISKANDKEESEERHEIRVSNVNDANEFRTKLSFGNDSFTMIQNEDGKEESFYITGGLLEVQPHLVTVLADTALRGDQLDEAAALASQQEAEEALKGASEETDIARAQGELAEARARYRAAQKLKGKR